MYRPVNDQDPALELARETRRLATIVQRLAKRDGLFAHPARYFLFSFLNGLFIFLGSTVGVALLIWILNILGYLPFIGDLSKMITRTIGQ